MLLMKVLPDYAIVGYISSTIISMLSMWGEFMRRRTGRQEYLWGTESGIDSYNNKSPSK